jgi:hypothetical protein
MRELCELLGVVEHGLAQPFVAVDDGEQLVGLWRS